jgi:hypothetical protein
MRLPGKVSTGIDSCSRAKFLGADDVAAPLTAAGAFASADAMRARRPPDLPAAAIAIVAATLAAGCHRGPRTPHDAYLALERAVTAGDAAAFFATLDDTTRWSIESTLHDQRLMRTIIGAKYPEAEAQKELARLSAAEEPDPARYFARLDEERHVVARYRPRLGDPVGALEARPEGSAEAWVGRAGGAPLRFRRNRSGSWGLAELGAEWSLEKDRAAHAVKTVRENAALYQRAGEK